MTDQAEPAGTGLTIPAVLEAQVRARPEQVALHVLDEPVTYRELRDRAVATAQGLRRLGVQAGDRVAIYMATCQEWVYTWFGASYLGAVTVPINVAYRGDFLANPLNDSRTSVVVVDEDLLPRLTAVAAELLSVRHIVVRPAGDAPDFGGTAVGFPVTTTADLVAEGGAVDSLGPAPAWNDPGAIFFTSGTTGRSKGALVTQHYLLTAAKTIVDSWQLQAGETVYGPLPLFHLSAIGTVLGPMLAGGTGVLEPGFSVHRTWDQVRRYDAVGIALAGALVVMLWNLPPDERDAELPLRFISAAPIPKELYHQIEDRYGCRIATCYGLSEAFPLAVAGIADDTQPGTAGRPNPRFEVAIFDEQDREVPAGGVGEIVCRPREPHVMFDGYDGRPEETLAQYRNLWFHTGDLGRLDQHGNLVYVDRKKDAMRRRGENISSFEIEQAILRHPMVDEVAAIGVPSELGEDDVMVCLVVTAGAALDVREFMDFCCERLPFFAVPRYVEIFPELPKNAMGRILKQDLRARGVTESSWDREKAQYTVHPDAGRGRPQSAQRVT